jgi:hypothetical protein
VLCYNETPGNPISPVLVREADSVTQERWL